MSRLLSPRYKAKSHLPSVLTRTTQTALLNLFVISVELTPWHPSFRQSAWSSMPLL